ncbi:MAG: glycerol-3-phosphate acyltransferase [Drouetiella hepatica Uher 2000/2452]|jgi:pyruvate,water dikinase|uniref:Glycerol-3-phosphate acyltransferase n=1 Tax=Drouetiella hepatica Uher 2000/2452 TaxID=904376 RepID=A0A951QFB2_9CYAN|nr:glycerol-3-phosphate acyltransferase [Drouetiella hepatica Uher 2000/2452]
MTLPPILGALLILIICPILGGLPLIAWITQALTQRKLAQLGTGNLSVSAAFYHGGQTAGILAVMSEAFKGIAAVLLARYLFPSSPVWELVALMALVMGRYGIGKGAGTTNVVWGFVVHDWLVASWVFLLGGIGFTLLRERQLGRLGVLVLLPIVVAVLHPYQSDRIFATMLLSLLMAAIYQRIPDDLDLSPETSSSDSRKMFQFFRGDRALLSLDRTLDAAKVGNKAANLSQLRRWGYPVPIGWVIPPGDDPAPLIEMLHPSPEIPLVVRSSAIGEDSETASAAGQYDSILHVTSQAALEQAILRCHASYNDESAVRYRQDRGIAEGAMAVVVQIQVQGVFSGVAFSRDPIARQGDAVVVEGLPGLATQVVSGQVTPEMYRVWIREEIDSKAYTLPESNPGTPLPGWLMPDWVDLDLEGTGDLPPRLVKQVAFLARHIEKQYHGIPQDIEWSYDGQHLWLLQSRPITTLLPIWTRKIAAEVIPGYIHPLTWSINRPLTCGAWGDLFTLVLGDRAVGLDFNETATLHHSAAYFNASLLGQLFLRMGLPPESLEFLTRGAKFSKPPLRSTLQSAPGLLRLLRRELRLSQDFSQDWDLTFEPGWAVLEGQKVDRLSAAELLQRIEQILVLLQRATYYSILAPLSAALRRAMFSVPEVSLDNSQTPEVASMRSLQSLANAARATVPSLDHLSPDTLCAHLAETSQGQAVLQEFDRFLSDYGYLSDVATDIAVPNWKEDPGAAKALFTQLLLNPTRPVVKPTTASGWKQRQVQKRLDLKGQVTALYSKLLAELRWSFLALEQQGLATGWLTQTGDIFFLKFAEVEQWILAPDPELKQQMGQRIEVRRSQLQSDRQLTPPLLVYGNDPPRLSEDSRPIVLAESSRQLHGIGASPGLVEGQVVILQSLQTYPEVSRDIILVIPYADSGWAPLLAQAGGLITEVGGQLSHGAIVAREYGIPAVMNIAHATQRLQDGQRVRLDGQQGIVEILL